MSRPVKNMVTDELRARYSELNSALWIEMTGVDGIATNRFRRALRAKEVRLEVVKNSLFKRAVGDGPLKPLAHALSGPAAILTGGESLVDVAKLVGEWLFKVKGIKLRGAVLEGKWLDESRVADLPKMLTRGELQAKVAAIIISPGAEVAAAIEAAGAQVASCLKTMIEKLENGEEISKDVGLIGQVADR